MDPAAQLTHIIPALNAVVDRIDRDQLGSPTTCDDFTVGGVLDHLLVLSWIYSHILRGEEPIDLEPAKTIDRVPAAEVAKAMQDLFLSFRSPEAMERIVLTPMGEFPGEVVARFVAFDVLVHSWDVAMATGHQLDLADEVVEDIEAFARTAITPIRRDSDMFEPPVEAPPGASPLERLVAFSGRSVPDHAST